MNFLLDVNVLVAWGWSDHSEQVRVAKWLGVILQGGNGTLHTSTIPQLGFVPRMPIWWRWRPRMERCSPPSIPRFRARIYSRSPEFRCFPGSVPE